MAQDVSPLWVGETDVQYQWSSLESLDLGPDCTFDFWLVQTREEGTGVWNSQSHCLGTSCWIQNLKCDTKYDVRVAAVCQALVQAP